MQNLKGTLNLRFILVAAILLAAGGFPLSTRAQSAGGLTLEAAMREALSKSEEALILQEKATRFKAVKGEAWSGAMPRVSAYANAGRGATPFDLSTLGFNDTTGGPTVINIAQNRFSYGLEASQLLFAFGRLGLVVKVANIQDRANTASRRRSRQELQLQVMDAYYGLVMSRARLLTLESSIKRQSRTVDFLESNFRMGSGFRSEVLLAVAALKALEPQRIRAERDAESARMALNRLLGRSISDPLEPDTSTALNLAMIRQTPDSLTVQLAIEERPDIQSMALQRRSLEGQARYVKMQYLPTLAAQGKVGVTAYKLNQLDEVDQNREWQVGVGLTWPLFDGLSNLSRAREIQSDARSLALTEHQVRKFAQMEIESAFREYQASDSALAAAAGAVQAAQEAQALLTEDFHSGHGRLTDLLAAEQGLREAEFGALTARFQRIRSQAALQVALGKSLITEEAP